MAAFDLEPSVRRLHDYLLARTLSDELPEVTVARPARCSATPWENYQPLDKEFFEAAGRPDIVEARTSAIRTRMIADLAESDAPLHSRYWAMQREFQGSANLFAKDRPWEHAGHP